MNAIVSILVPVDFSTGSRSVLEHDARMASLQVLHVVDTAAEPLLRRLPRSSPVVKPAVS